jgi:glycine dehydrogenase
VWCLPRLGNAAVLLITGCTRRQALIFETAIEIAILSANYISARLKDHSLPRCTPVPTAMAHECILDLRPLKEASGGANGLGRRCIQGLTMVSMRPR